MRRHTKEGFSRGDIQGRINAVYREEQVKRTPPWGKYPGCNGNGSPIRWSPADRFSSLNLVAYERRYFKFRYSKKSMPEVRWEDKLRLMRYFREAQRADKPRLP